MRLLVTGGRNYSDLNAVVRVLNRLRPGYLIVGDAPGADAHARTWGEANQTGGVMTYMEIYHADWQSFGAKAGPLRNARMLAEGKPDLVLAFPGGRGTEDMCRRAKAAGVPVLRVEI